MEHHQSRRLVFDVPIACGDRECIGGLLIDTRETIIMCDRIVSRFSMASVLVQVHYDGVSALVRHLAQDAKLLLSEAARSQGLARAGFEAGRLWFEWCRPG